MFVQKKFRVLLAAVAVGAMLSGCAGQTQGQRNQAAGTLIGTAAGAAIGSRIGDGLGRTAAVAGGALVGGLLGNALASELTPQDQGYRQQTFHRTFDSAPPNSTQNWGTPGGNTAYGSVTPTTTTFSDPRTRQRCRQYSEEIFVPGSQGPQTVRGKACRNPDGSWRRVN